MCAVIACAIITTVPNHIRELPGNKGGDGMAEVTTKNFVAKIDDLIPSEENPRKIGRKEFEALIKSLQEFPEMKQLREIIVDEDMQILAGHQRIYALKELDYEDVYVRQVFGLTKKQKREFMIKDNVSAGSWDADVIDRHWDKGLLESFGVPKMKMPGEIEPEDQGDDEYKHHSVTCPACGHDFQLSEQD